MRLREFVLDAWSWLGYKTVMREPGALPELRAGWIPENSIRRLAAYKVLAAYDSNAAGQLSAGGGEDQGLDRRELGDASKLIDTAVSHVLGSSQAIVVPGADQHADVDEPSRSLAVAVQQRLRAWADAELVPLKLQQLERTTVRLGDGVLLLAWDPVRRRPRVRVYDPGFYFPEFDDDDEDFPTRVHLAWELPAEPQRGLKARLRRITYELGPTPHGPRRYPWSPQSLSATTCYLTDGEWLLEDIRYGQTVETLPLDRAHIRTAADGQPLNRRDLMIDFVPVIQFTNTVPEAGEHWGQPLLAKVLQGLDELAATDSDASAASATTGSPIVGLAGARLPVNPRTGEPQQLRVQAGTVWQLGESGRMDVLDTSPQLAELRARAAHLQDRIASNSRLTTAGLGILDPSEVPSGYALSLSLAPLESLIGQMRLAREYKYQLMLRMVQRLFQAGQAEDWPEGPSHVAKLVFGAHTLADRSAVLGDVTRALEAGLISLETGLRMLVEAGYPITSVADEVALIRQGRSAPES